MLATIGIPNLIRARANSNDNACLNDLNILAGAQESYGRENRLVGSDPVLVTNLVPFIPRGKLPKCPLNGTYSLDYMGNNPRCSISEYIIP